LSNLIAQSNNSENGSDYGYYTAATFAAPFAQPFVDYLRQAATNGANPLQIAYDNYQSGNGAQTSLLRASVPQTQPAASSTATASYMPVQSAGERDVMALANALGPVPGGAALQPGYEAVNQVLPDLNAHGIYARAATVGNQVSSSQLMNMSPRDYEGLTQLQQQEVNRAIMNALSGSYARTPEQLGYWYLQKGLGPNNLFYRQDTAAFMKGVQESYRSYPGAQNSYGPLSTELGALGSHAERITQQLKSEYKPINDDGFLRQSLWENYKAPLSSLSQGGFNYREITADRIYKGAQTLKQVADIHGGYHTMKAGILGAGQPYQNSLHCVGGGLINFENIALLEKFAAGGELGRLPNWSLFNPWSWGRKTEYFKYPAGVLAYLFEKKVVGVLPGQYTLDGKEWIPRLTSPAIQKAQEGAMTRLIEEDKKFFNIEEGRYPNCRYGDVLATRKVPPGQTPRL
jgi:hypothetical protein